MQALKDRLPSSGVSEMSEQVLDQVRKSLGCGRIRHALISGNSQPGTTAATVVATASAAAESLVSCTNLLSLPLSAPAAVFRFFGSELGLNLTHCYGQTETCGILTWTFAKDQKDASHDGTNGSLEKNVANESLYPVGAPLPECHFKLSDDGEILVKGPHLFVNYFKVLSLLCSAVWLAMLFSQKRCGFSAPSPSALPLSPSPG